MMIDSLWAFFAIAVVVIATPGQDTALTIRNTIAGGRKGGVMTALGVSAGQAVWAMATAFGVIAVLLASEPVFAAVKLAGALYLIYLGGQSLWQALRERSAQAPSATLAPRLGAVAALRQGILSNLANPKMAVFFVSLLPQFAPPSPSGDGAAVIVLAALGLVFCTMTFVWLTGYALAVAMAGEVLRRGAARRWLEGLTGGALIGLGLHVAARD